MMRKWLIILLLFPLILLSSRFSNPPEVIIQYESTKGGYVEGELQQKVKWGYDAKEVTAIANELFDRILNHHLLKMSEDPFLLFFQINVVLFH